MKTIVSFFSFLMMITFANGQINTKVKTKTFSSKNLVLESKTISAVPAGKLLYKKFPKSQLKNLNQVKSVKLAPAKKNGKGKRTWKINAKKPQVTGLEISYHGWYSKKGFEIKGHHQADFPARVMGAWITFNAQKDKTYRLKIKPASTVLRLRGEFDVYIYFVGPSTKGQIDPDRFRKVRISKNEPEINILFEAERAGQLQFVVSERKAVKGNQGFFPWTIHSIQVDEI